jgi:hypothetical protein
VWSAGMSAATRRWGGLGSVWCSGAATAESRYATALWPHNRYPTEVEWPTFIDGFIRSLGLVENPYTTQAIHP